jgi:Flp pilus assembly protein TadD
MGREIMKKTIKTLAAVALAALALPAAAQEIPVDGPTMLPVAYEALRDGRPHEALRQLANMPNVDARDPSRLINMGTAHARLGRTDEAAAHYRAAIDSPIRYDLELADGRTMDSRWAARMALQQLQTKGRVTVAFADIR